MDTHYIIRYLERVKKYNYYKIYNEKTDREK